MNPLILAPFFFTLLAHAETPAAAPVPPLKEYCIQSLKDLPGKSDPQQLESLCSRVAQLPECSSEKGLPIFHFDQTTNREEAKRILTFALTHGDEAPSGSVARGWMERISRIPIRNHWRVIPIANPDGLKAKQRMNSKGVDINRNFPTKDWSQSALQAWTTQFGSDPRRFPGQLAASELETKCAMKHVEEFKPDFVISLHTPYGMLDFDGPRLKSPSASPLPWISLGNFPGSLGRYLWVDRKIPVLTIELKGNVYTESFEKFDQLQDISGTIAAQAQEALSKKSAARSEEPGEENPPVLKRRGKAEPPEPKKPVENSEGRKPLDQKKPASG